MDTSQVYAAGRHFVSADYTFRVFPRDSHFVSFTNLFVFAAPSESTLAEVGRSSFEMTIDVSFQYFIRPSELANLHSEYELQYSTTIISAAESAIKGQNQFTPEQFILNRTLIERTLLAAVQDRLGGVGCCDSYCADTRFDSYPTISGVNCQGCSQDCPSANQTFHVDVRFVTASHHQLTASLCLDLPTLPIPPSPSPPPSPLPPPPPSPSPSPSPPPSYRYFQLKQITLPSELRASFLAQIIEAEDAQTETFVQDLTVVNAEIQREVKAIENEAERISEQANADSALIARQAQANVSGACRLVSGCGHCTPPPHL